MTRRATRRAPGVRQNPPAEADGSAGRPAGPRPHRVVFDALRANRGALAVAGLASFGQPAVLLAIPVFTRLALDDIARSDDSRLPQYAAALVVLGVARGAAGATRRYFGGRLTALVGSHIRVRLFDHLQALSFGFYDRLGAGQIMARASSDVVTVENGVMLMPYAFQVVVVFVGAAAALLLIDLLLGVVSLVALSTMAFVSYRQGAPMQAASRRAQDAIGEFTQYAEQQVQGVRIIKGHGLEARSLERAGSLSTKVRTAVVDFAVVRSRTIAAVVLTPAAPTLVVLAFGAWLGSRGALSVGEFVEFMQLLALLLAPVQLGSQLATAWPQAMGASSRILDVLGEEAEIRSPAAPAALPAGRGTVRFDDVWFGYRTGVPVLRGVTLEVEGGTSLALVGSAGSGKSTLALLIPRFYDPWRGQVSLDGTPVGTLDVTALRHEVAIVFEDTVVFSGTIRENIAVGRPGAGDDDIAHAAQVAQLAPFVESLPHGYDTPVGSLGGTLSGGQRQRLSLARAVLRNPRVLILDDATSALDPHTAAAMKSAVDEALPNTTKLVVAHRVETVRNVDRVVLLRDGEVVAQGTHDELTSVPEYRVALGIDVAVA